MAVSKIKKIRIIGLKKDKKKILDFLQKREAIEIIKPDFYLSPQNDLNDNFEYDLSEIKFAINFLNKFSQEKISLKDKILGVKINIKEKDFSNFLNSYQYQDIISRAQSLEQKLNESLNKIEEAKNNVSSLLPWQSLRNNFLAKETLNIKIFFGVMAEKNYVNLVQRLNVYKLLSLRQVNKIEKNLYLEIIFAKEEKEIESILEQAGFEKKELPLPGISPKKAISELEFLIKKEEANKKEIRKNAIDLAKELNNLRITFDITNAKNLQKEAEMKIAETEKTFIITGWTEERFLEQLTSELNTLFPDIFIESLPINEKEDVPVVINNSHFLSPFESVTKIYGLPKYNEIDPTSVLAPFFILFFGFAVSDAGYGIILMLLSFLAIKVLPAPKSSHKMIRLLGYGGLATFMVGALFGGWFGVNIALMPALFLQIQLINPIENPLVILMISLALGIVQVIFGKTISFYWKIKDKKLKEAILDDGTWIFFLIAICLFGGLSTGLVSETYSRFIMSIFWLGLLGVVLAGGRKQKNPFLKIISGAGGLYGLIGYFSDVLSYSRLLALGLATGIIAMVINTIAGIANEMIPYLGPVIALAILIGGHIFNIVINTLSAFIHSGRLQFVEFFPKFMEGGGRKFAPLLRGLKFVNID